MNTSEKGTSPKQRMDLFDGTSPSDVYEDWSRWQDVVFLARERLKLGCFDRPASSPSTVNPTFSDSSKFSVEEALSRIHRSPPEEEMAAIATFPGTQRPRHCSVCYAPLHRDPPPEEMYIFLHALRYTTSLGTFESDMPAWAAKGRKWNRG